MSEVDKYAAWFSAVALPIVGIYVCGKTLVAYFPRLMRRISNKEMISLGGRLPDVLRVSPRELITGFGVQSFFIIVFLPFRYQIMQVFLSELQLSQFPWNAYLCFSSLFAVMSSVVPAILKSMVESFRDERRERKAEQDEIRKRTDRDEIVR